MRIKEKNEIQEILMRYTNINVATDILEEIFKLFKYETTFFLDGNEYYVYAEAHDKPSFMALSEIERVIWNVLAKNLGRDDAEKCFHSLFLKDYVPEFDTITIQGSDCPMYSTILKHKPANSNEEKFLSFMTRIKLNEINSFRIPTMDPSLDEYGRLQFVAGARPAVGFSYKELEKKADKEIKCRFGTRYEYFMFLATLILKLQEVFPEADVWSAVCTDSIKLGHYFGSENAKHGFEPTGSRCFGGRCDLANTYKILSADTNSVNKNSYYRIGGDYRSFATNNSLISYTEKYDIGEVLNYGVGWFVVK